MKLLKSAWSLLAIFFIILGSMFYIDTYILQLPVFLITCILIVLIAFIYALFHIKL